MLDRVTGWTRNVTQGQLNRILYWGETLGPVLAMVGALATTRGIYYLIVSTDYPPYQGGHPVETWWGLVWWGAAWLVVGVVSVLASLRPSQPVARLAIAGLVFLNALWGLSTLAESIFLGGGRGWILAFPHLASTGLLLWANWISGRCRRARGPYVDGPADIR